MSRKVKSIKGDVVDFDLFLVKEQIGKTPKTDEVLQRERYVDVKRRRATRKDINQLLAEQNKNKRRAQKALEESKLKAEKDKDAVEEPKEKNSTVEVKEVKEEKETKPEKKTTKRRVVRKK